jgi:hypothetical protein
MKTSSSKISIIKDTAIFDYVAGHQSAGARENFEKSVEQNPKLKAEVVAEEQLSKNLKILAAADNVKSVSMKNFEALLDRIDREENPSNHFGSEASNISISSGGLGLPNSRSWMSLSSVAVSVFLFAIVAFIGVQQAIEPNFETLSNDVASAEVDFTGLVEQHRMIKIEFSDALSESEIDLILKTYQLTVIQSGAHGSVMLLSSSVPVDGEQLALWSKNASIKSAKLVSIGAASSP